MTTKKKRLTIAQAAVKHLADNDHDFVMWGDTLLLHEINAAAGLQARGWKTEEYVLNALDRSPVFTKKYIRVHGRLVRMFYPTPSEGDNDE